jgi:hypothetical protein
LTNLFQLVVRNEKIKKKLKLISKNIFPNFGEIYFCFHLPTCSRRSIKFCGCGVVSFLTGRLIVLLAVLGISGGGKVNAVDSVANFAIVEDGVWLLAL